MGLFSLLLSWIAPVFIVVSPLTSYSDQILSIRRNRSSAGFSLDIPLIMLVSSILRVFYYLRHPFSLPLLYQSFIMIGVQLLLLSTALHHRPPLPPTLSSYSTPHAPPPPPLPFLPRTFWRWPPPHTRPYALTLLYLTAALLVLHLVLPSSTPLYTPLLGALGLGIEATLPMPQLLTNYRRRGCKGFRASVLFSWLIGDAMKMMWFFQGGGGGGGDAAAAQAEKIPLAFKLCAAVQAVCDAGLGVQWWMWGDGKEDDAAEEEVEKEKLRHGNGNGVVGIETLEMEKRAGLGA
ncbi:MAG: hypothetical protein M1833_004667 [Piccolia ochrophora]|nr:MAG: hypothetical protein M1833_004667 [Piccolia ochrophora]